MPATNASVVIRIGRRRSRQAWTIGVMRARARLRAADWRDRSAESSSSSRRRTAPACPSAEKMFSDWPKMTIEISANGSVSGSDSRIVTGCSHDSNCAASTRYMKIERQRERLQERAGGAIELARPAGEAGAVFRSRARAACAASAICCLRGAPATCRAACWRPRSPAAAGSGGGCRPAHRRARTPAMLSSATLPRRDDGTVQRGNRRLRTAVLPPRRAGAPRTARPPRCRSSPDRRRRAGAALRPHRRPARRGRRPSGRSSRTDISGLPDAQRRVDVHQPGNRARLLAPARCWPAPARRGSGPASRTDVALAAAAARRRRRCQAPQRRAARRCRRPAAGSRCAPASMISN